MNLQKRNLYKKDIEKVARLPLNWNKLVNKSILISGSSGMIGSYLIDVLMYKNKVDGLNCKIYALGRNINRAKERFEDYWNESDFLFIISDINTSIDIDINNIDYIIHAASNTHPVAYATDPIGTITTNIIGTYNLLEFAVKHQCERFVFTSSVEIYGENRGDCEMFKEDYCGYIDCNSLRAGYPESKRAGESLCQAYIKQNDLDIVIPRLSRTYGPTLLMSDTKAISQFIKKGVTGEDIVLKSDGNQFYSYTYVADAVSGILCCMFNGQCGETYNIGDEESNIALKDLARLIADYTNTKVIFELPDETERAGYSKATKAVLDSYKLKGLGWKAMFNIKTGLERTIDMLKN